MLWDDTLNGTHTHSQTILTHLAILPRRVPGAARHLSRDIEERRQSGRKQNYKEPVGVLYVKGGIVPSRQSLVWAISFLRVFAFCSVSVCRMYCKVHFMCARH